jgi:hypothetical protein
MGAVMVIVYRVRKALPRRWVATAVVAVLIAMVTGTVLTLVAGVRRTAAAPDAYTKYVGGDQDALLQQREGPPLTEKVASLPSVRWVSTITFTFAEVDPQRQTDVNTLTFAGTLPYGSRLIEGRLADPTKPHEFIADEAFARAHDAKVGDVFPVASLSQQQADRGEFENPEGPQFEGELVGIMRSAAVLESEYSIAVFSTALLAVPEQERVPIVASVMSVHLQPDASVEELRGELDRLPDGAGKEISLEREPVISTDIRQAVDAQAQGIAVMALVATVLAVVALGQLLSRHARLAAADRRVLASMGSTRRQLGGETVLTAAVPAAAGLVGGVLLASAASSRFPVGFVRLLEPDPGIKFDATALGLGALALFVLLLVWVAVAFVAQGRTPVRTKPSLTTESLVRRAPGPAAALGVRFALTGREGSSRSTRGTMFALAFVVSGLVGATAFAVSVRELVRDQSRFGLASDYQVGAEAGYFADDLRTRLEGDKDIEALTILSEASVRYGNVTVALVGVDQVRGGLTPHVLNGRLPTSADEIALGHVTGRRLDVGIGEEIRFGETHSSDPLRVVGHVVVPGIGGNDGVGEGAVVTEDGLAKLSESNSSLAAIDLRPGAAPDAKGRIEALMGTELGTGQDRPSSILNVARIRGIPGVLAAILAVLVLLMMVHAVIVSVQSRRHEVAIVRAMGADRGWIARVVHWQATSVTAVPLVVGVPVGLLLGAVVFRAFVNRIGAVPDPTIPLLLVAGCAAALLLAANVVALIPSRRARRVPTADLLRVE